MSKDLVRKIYLGLSTIRSIPALIIYNISSNKKVIKKDIDLWFRRMNIDNKNMSYYKKLNYLLISRKEFRNVFYYRLGKLSGIVLNIFYPKLKDLHICTNNIGPGLFISHGFSTIIAAKSIGENCMINQQVTIGYGNNPIPPTIGDNVRIGANSTIIGNIKIGNNSKIGAGAIVVKDVPENCTVIGNPAIIVKKDGEKVRYNL